MTIDTGAQTVQPAEADRELPDTGRDDEQQPYDGGFVRLGLPGNEAEEE